MSLRSIFRDAATLAVENIIRFGDTDVFPRSFESHAFFDKRSEVVDLVCQYNNNFIDYIRDHPPSNINALTPVSYYGFRWATQLDPIWNIHFLSCVLAIGEQIEDARIPVGEACVFSYRFKPDTSAGELFDRDYGWVSFMQKSLEKASRYDYVIACDISEFYPRLNHHRLENALQQIAADTGYPAKIMKFLSNFSNTRSFGLPIGGPAARLLSELTINQIDRLLRNAKIDFTRFADDFHIFAKTKEEAYRYTIFLSQKLFENQGFSLQKSKTRIMTSAEFRSVNPPASDLESDPEEHGKQAATTHARSQSLLRFSLRFDPYSPTAEEDYEKLRQEIRQFDILGLLREELAKSRLHVALSRKIIAAIRYLDGTARENAVLSLLENSDILYPIFTTVLIMIEGIYHELEAATKNLIETKLIELIRSDSHVLKIDVHLCFAIRVLQNRNSEDVQQLLKELYQERPSKIIRRDIIIVMAK